MIRISVIILLFAIIQNVTPIEYEDLQFKFVIHTSGRFPNFKLGRILPEMRQNLLSKLSVDPDLIPAFYEAVIFSKACFVQMLLLKKGDIDILMAQYGCPNTKLAFSCSGKIFDDHVAYLAYDINHPDPTQLILPSIDYTRLESAYVLDFINPAIESSTIRALQPFPLEDLIPLSYKQIQYGAYRAHISTNLPVIIGHLPRVIRNVEAIVLVMPIEHALPNFEQSKYINRFYRIAKKAFIRGHKCWIVAIEIGNGDFSDLLPGLTIPYLAYAQLVGQTAIKMDNAEERTNNGIKVKSITLDSYTLDPRSSWGTFHARITLMSSIKIAVHAKVVSLSLNRDIDDKEIQNLKREHDRLVEQKNQNQLICFVSHASVPGPTIKQIAFLAYTDIYQRKQIRLKISNRISVLFATYLSFVGRLMTAKPNVPVLDENTNIVALDPILLREYMQNTEVSWASYRSIIDGVKVGVRVQIIYSPLGHTTEILKSEYNRRKSEKSNKFLRFCSNAIINNLSVAFLVYDIPNYIEPGRQFTNDESFFFAKYASLIGGELNKNRGAQVVGGKLESYRLNNLIVKPDVTWAIYDTKIDGSDDGSISVQILDPAQGYTSEKLKSEYERRRLEKRKQYMRFCSNATVHDAHVAFLVSKGKEQGERIDEKTLTYVKYASFVNRVITQQDAVHVIDENGYSVRFEPLRLTDYTKNPEVTWASYEAKSDVSTSPSGARVERRFRVKVQLLDAKKNFADETLNVEYERRKKENPTEYLRYCPMDVINNEKVAFLVYSASVYMEPGEIRISYEMPRLFLKYSSFIGRSINGMMPLIYGDHRTIMLDKITLFNYIQNADVTWASYESIIMHDIPIRVHVKLQWLDPMIGYATGYLKDEFEQRCKEEETKIESIRRKLYFCERAWINGESVAFLAYSFARDIPDSDEDRLTVYEPNGLYSNSIGQELINYSKKRSIHESSSSESEPKSKRIIK